MNGGRLRLRGRPASGRDSPLPKRSALGIRVASSGGPAVRLPCSFHGVAIGIDALHADTVRLVPFLDVHLGLVERKLNIRTDGRFYPPEVESAISAFLLECEVAFVVADSPEDALMIERELIQTLRPTLNVNRA
jgi:hypothetical protein